MSAEEAQALGRKEFWDERYGKADEDKQTHEWFRAFNALEPFFTKHLFAPRKSETQPMILHLGSGDSTIPYDLLSRGYNNQICVDFSSVVVDLMKSRYSDKPEVEWKMGDVRAMIDFDAKSVDVAFDKGTLDAMIYGDPWSPPEEVMNNSGKYISEVLRILRDDGVFLYVTYRQPHLIKPILNRNNEWIMEMEVMGGGGSFEYYGFVLTKNASIEA